MGKGGLMFSPIEKEAIRIILGMRGEQPKNLKQLALQLFPDLANCSAPSLDKRVQSLKGTLEQRSGLNKRSLNYSLNYSLYYAFYFKKRRGEKFDPTACSPEDLTFLEEVYQHCPSWITLQEKIRNVVVFKGADH